ncbi:MAG: CapA family protein [Bacteroidetes bacterium]|nr:CapA family protein [Bacteroidota bacterium]
MIQRIFLFFLGIFLPTCLVFGQDKIQVPDSVQGINLIMETDSSVNLLENVPPTSKSICIAAVGDIMLGSAYPAFPNHLPPDDGLHLLDSVKPWLQNATLTFGNLEGTYLDDAIPTSKKCRDSTKCYAFRSPERYFSYVAEAGFDLLSLANNHSGDFGIQGRERTMQLADSFGLTYAGLQSCPFAILTVDSIRYGFAAFAPNSGCMQLNDLKTATGIVDHLDSLCDITIISFHGGAEGSKFQHVAQGTEKFLGENRGNLRLFTHTLIDHGADLILGHGPHVTRGMEVYKERLIAYSLGNFATYERFNLSGPNGVCPLLLVNLDSSGKFIEGQIIAIRQVGEGIPMLDPSKQVISLIQNLSQSDFPKTYPAISEEGLISPRE